MKGVRVCKRSAKGGLYRERNGREMGLIFELGLGGD
jgi:hypothetical protein